MKRSILLTSFLALSLWAVDFSQMTTEQLIQMRGSVAVEDRDAYRAQMQSRLQNMTQEERAAFMASRQVSGMGGNMGADRPTFTQLDSDGDGKITQSELEAAQAARMEAKAAQGRLLKNAGNAPAFSTLDTNGDGSIDANEFQAQQQAAMQSRMKNMRQRGNQMNTQMSETRLQNGSRRGQMMQGMGRGR